MDSPSVNAGLEYLRFLTVRFAVVPYALAWLEQSVVVCDWRGDDAYSMSTIFQRKKIRKRTIEEREIHEQTLAILVGRSRMRKALSASTTSCSSLAAVKAATYTRRDGKAKRWTKIRTARTADGSLRNKSAVDSLADKQAKRAH